MKIQVASHSDCFLILLMSLSFAPFQFILSLDMQITKEAFREARLNDFKDVFNKRPAKDSLERKDLNELIQYLLATTFIAKKYGNQPFAFIWARSGSCLNFVVVVALIHIFFSWVCLLYKNALLLYFKSNNKFNHN